MIQIKGMRIAALFFIFSICSLSTLAQGPQAPPYQWPRSHDYDVQHYKIRLSFDWDKKEVLGDTTITLRPFKSGLKEIELDAGQMNINTVKLATGLSLKFRYEDSEKLYIALDRGYSPAEEISVSINYSTKPKEGLRFITPNESEPNRPYQIWTEGEPDSNHYWFPCYDYPNDRATSEMIVTVENKYRVISNGKLISVRPNPSSKTKTWCWRLDQPFSSYLISIVVGEFAEIKDYFKSKPVISYVYPDQVENARLSFGNLGKMVAYFSERIGLDYPYDKYSQTTVRGFPGALENITATTMSDTSVHDSRAHLDVSSDSVVAHELAHQWFGNLITCRDWSELWLNESFATFFSSVWAEYEQGKDDYLYSMIRNKQQYFQTWSREERRRPIVTRRYSGSNSIFGTYAYQQGAAVINMLRFVLGEELFWKSINHYVKKYQGQSIETQQLILAIEEATGQNLSWFFDEWIYKMGHPEFEITSSYDENAKRLKLTVKQTQKPDEKRPWYQSPDFFTMPVDIALTTESGEKVHRVLIDKREKDFEFLLDSRPLIINFDRGDYIIKEVRFNRNDDEVAYQLLHDPDVTGRIRAAIELARRRSETSVKALSEAAGRDVFWGVRLEATKALKGANNETARSGLLKAIEDKDSRIRRAAVEGLSTLKDVKLAELYKKIIKTDPSYFAVAEATEALSLTGAPGTYDILVELLKQESWQDTIRNSAIRGLAELKDKRALDFLLVYTRPGNSTGTRGAALQAIGELGKGSDRAYETLIAALREPSSQIQFNALLGLRSLSDERAIPALEEFVKKADINQSNRPLVNSLIQRLRQGQESKKTGR